MKTKWILVAAVLALLGGLIWFRLRLNGLDDRKAKAIANALRATVHKIGITKSVKLPSQFRPLSVNGSVDVVRLKSGKLGYFLIASYGYHGDYRGYIYVDSGIPFRLGKDFYNRSRSTIDIFNDGGSYYIIDRKISPNLYAVFFDLG